MRIIAATNRDLRRAVEEGRFRQDLFYRLNVITITLLPLRDRKEDIPLLVDRILEQLASELKRDVEGVSPDAMAILLAHDWPGNVRELRNVLERAIVVSDAPILEARHLGLNLLEGATGSEHPASLEEVERRHIGERPEADRGQRDAGRADPRHRPRDPLRQDSQVRAETRRGRGVRTRNAGALRITTPR